MAGGIEVVGIVLALYPIVVDTWQAYKAAKSGTEVNQMIQRLQTEQIVFQEFVHHLVGSSITESQRALLIGSKPRERGQQGEEVGCWHDPGLQADLKARLGFEKMQNILTIVENIQALLGCMSKELPGAARTLVSQQERGEEVLDITFNIITYFGIALIWSGSVRRVNTPHSPLSNICDRPNIFLMRH